MSTGLGLPTILDCLRAGEKEMGLEPEGWQAGTNACDEQKLFAAKQVGWRQGLALFGSKSLRSYATAIHENVLAKMKEWNMRIAPPPNLGFTAVYMISQLKELLKWVERGKRYQRGVAWPEFKLSDAEFFRFGPGERDLVVTVKTENGDTVYLMPDNTGTSLEGMALLEAILETEDSMKPESFPKYKGVVVPCVMAKIKTNLEWILGLANQGNVIVYAEQEIEFGMNELGFAVREETVLGSLRSIKPPRQPEPFILSLNGEPFRFWRRRASKDGDSYLISMFQFTRDHFVDPGNLEDIVK